MRSFADASPEVKRIVGDRYVYHSKWFANTRTVNRLELFHVESSLIFSRQAARKVSTEETATHVWVYVAGRFDFDGAPPQSRYYGGAKL
jgi:hypothetical protein